MQGSRHKINWRKVCKPKVEGGLGIKDIATWNKATVCKRTYKLVAGPITLWQQWAKNHLVKAQQFWTMACPTDCSCVWRGMLGTRSLMGPFSQYSIGQGNLSFWNDPWSQFGILGEKFNATVRYRSRVRDNTPLRSFINDGHWVTPSHTIPEMQEIWEQDLFIWTPHPKDTFSIATAYEVLRERSPKLQCWKQLWGPHHIPRHSFITWVTWQNALSTMDKLVDWKLVPFSNCKLCNMYFQAPQITNLYSPDQAKPELDTERWPSICSLELYAYHYRSNSTSMRNWVSLQSSSSNLPINENEHHLFFDCPWANDVWKSVLQKIGVHKNVLPSYLEWKWIIKHFKEGEIDQKIVQAAATATGSGLKEMKGCF